MTIKERTGQQLWWSERTTIAGWVCVCARADKFWIRLGRQVEFLRVTATLRAERVHRLRSPAEQHASPCRRATWYRALYLLGALYGLRFCCAMTRNRIQVNVHARAAPFLALEPNSLDFASVARRLRLVISAERNDKVCKQIPERVASVAGIGART